MYFVDLTVEEIRRNAFRLPYSRRCLSVLFFEDTIWVEYGLFFVKNKGYTVNHQVATRSLLFTDHTCIEHIRLSKRISCSRIAACVHLKMMAKQLLAGTSTCTGPIYN